MEIEQALHERTIMEQRIRAAIHESVAEFKAITGLSPKSITVEMHEVTTVEAPRPVFVVGDVSAAVEI